MTFDFRLGLTGYPLGHSLSPKIHAAALTACGLTGDYSLFPVHPSDPTGLARLLARLRAGELTGLNVTIPHKQAVIPFLDELTETAQSIGAVNTIACENGRLIGHNTDAPGFLSDLKNFLKSQKSLVEGQDYQLPVTNYQFALVLGAGGSARAVVYALANAGWTVALAARRPEQARELVESLKIARSHCEVITFEQIQSTDMDLIVNTTPLGMTPNLDASPWPEGVPFPDGAVLYDLVYNPRETCLVREARAAGLPATTGLGMLVEQAALAFEIWTGYRPPRTELWQTVESGK
jgi:shikimate dehydrogenase